MIKQTFFVPGALPGMNDIIKIAKKRNVKGFPIYSALKTKYTKLVANVAIQSQIKTIDSFWLNIHWIEEHKKRDPDNIAAGIKFILDGMKLANIIIDDGWKHNKGWTNYFHVGDPPGVKVEIISYK